jgi:hypothetical protein
VNLRGKDITAFAKKAALRIARRIYNMRKKQRDIILNV